MKNDLVFIKHLLDGINSIEKFSRNLTKEKLSTDELRQFALIRAIEVLGEAARNISTELKKRYPEVEWKKMIGTRDKLIHHYFGVDNNVIWEIIITYLPILKKQIQSIKLDLLSGK